MDREREADLVLLVFHSPGLHSTSSRSCGSTSVNDTDPGCCSLLRVVLSDRQWLAVIPGIPDIVSISALLVALEYSVWLFVRGTQLWWNAMSK